MKARAPAAPAPAAERAPAPPACVPVHLQALPDIPKSRLSCAPLLWHIPREALRASFLAAPQFAGIPLQQILEDHRGALRVILLADSSYYAAQAAVYMTTLFTEDPAAKNDDDSLWYDLELLAEEKDSAPQPALNRSLAVAVPALLDPGLEEPAKPRNPIQTFTSGVSESFPFSLVGGLMLAAPSGPVLTPRVLDRMEELKETNVFFALQPGQVDLELLEELRFTWGFQVCRVGRPTQDYLRRFLLQSAGDLLITIDPLTDLDQVIAHTRRLRGGAFCEKDLESLLHWAVQRRAPLPLTGKDLMFRPYQPKREAWDRLKAMTGLDEVKDALRRILATAILENRRRQSGALPQPFCRNLAFSGPPGTGKSAAARLTAQILREEGCGTGRFIEAGREQLIGTYLGETSPKIAELFKKARGGVLFIDEAGALLDGGNDIYAAEAVNALVRHMELDPETMVILATYPREMAQLLASNPGLSSRIAQVLDFPPYTDEDLWQILQSFAAQAPTPCTLPPEARQISTAFFSTLRRRTGPRFGNAREARRLFQASIQELALRLLDTPSAPDNTLTRQDLKNAAHRLLTQPANESRSVGFRA